MIYAILGFFLILCASFIRRVKDKYADVCIATALPVFLLLLAPIGIATAGLRPAMLDLAFRQADLALGLDGLALTRWLASNGLYFAFVLPI
jgi:hypothetical protein